MIEDTHVPWSAYHEVVARALAQSWYHWVRRQMTVQVREDISRRDMLQHCRIAVFQAALTGAPVTIQTAVPVLKKLIRCRYTGEAYGVVTQRGDGESAWGDEWTVWHAHGVPTPKFRKSYGSPAYDRTAGCGPSLSIEQLAALGRTEQSKTATQTGYEPTRFPALSDDETDPDEPNPSESTTRRRAAYQDLIDMLQVTCPKEYRLLYPRCVLGVSIEQCLDDYIAEQRRPEVASKWKANRTLGRNAYHKAIKAAKSKAQHLLATHPSLKDIPRLFAAVQGSDATDGVRVPTGSDGAGAP